MKDSRHAIWLRSYALAVVVALSPGLLVLGSCDPGNTKLLVLEFKVNGQDQILNFADDLYFYPVSTTSGTAVLNALSDDPAAFVSYQWYDIDDNLIPGVGAPIGAGGGEVTVDVPSGINRLRVWVKPPGSDGKAYSVYVTRADPVPLTVAMTDNVISAVYIFPYDLDVVPTSAIAPNQTFTADLSGTVEFPEWYLDLLQDMIPGGASELAMVELKATVQTRGGGATGADVTLGWDDTGFPYECGITGGACDPANDQAGIPGGRGNTDCVPTGSFNPCNRFVDLPTSADCAPLGVCEGLGKQPQCTDNGFCITGNLLFPLEPVLGASYVAGDGASPGQTEALFGWADTPPPATAVGVPNIDVDGTWNMLASSNYSAPTGALGIRMNASGLFLSLEGVMGTDSNGPAGVGVPDDASPIPDSSLVSFPVTQPGGPCEKTQIVNVACTENVTNNYHGFPWELSVSVPTAITGGGTFDAEFDGEVVFTETYLDFWQAVIPGGATSMEILDSAATVQVRSGATGPDVVLGIDYAVLSPGATQFCNFPPDQTCLVNGDCLGAVCNQPILLQDFPTSTDCSPGGVCDLLGKSASQCTQNGFCVTGGLAMELVASVPTTFTADQSGNVLFGWADQGVSGLSVCPVGLDCSRPLPNDAYNLPQAVYPNPAAPMGLRFSVAGGGLFLANQCAMGEDGGACSTTTSLGCLTDTDCPGAETCIGVGVDDDIIMPTPDANLISCPIDAGVPPVSCANLVCNFTTSNSAIKNYYVPTIVNPADETLPWSGSVNIDCQPNGAQCDCTADLTGTIGPITLPGIGDLCLVPMPPGACPTGTISCDAGTDKNITQTQRHDIGACADNPGCRTDCDAHCATLGAVRVANSPACEGFCRTADTAMCWGDDDTSTPLPGFSVCPAGDTCDELTEDIGHDAMCGCQCIDIGDGAPAAPGEALLHIGFAVEIFFDNNGDGIAEQGVGPDGVACTADDEDPPGTLPAVCVPYTTSTASVYLPDAGYLDPMDPLVPITGVIDPPDTTGAPFACSGGVPSTAIGAVLQGLWTDKDSRRYDLASMVTITCE